MQFLIVCKKSANGFEKIFASLVHLIFFSVLVRGF